MNLFRVRGILLAVHFSFFLMLGVVGWFGWQEGAGVGLWWSVVTLLMFFTCVVLHELGHSFTAMHYGVNVRRILLMPIGGMAEFDGIPRQPVRELLITIAGPAVNFAIAGGLWLCFGISELEVHPDRHFPTSAPEFVQVLLHWNLLMGCFNLVPVFPMDGGRIFRALLATRLNYLRATFIAALVGKILAASAFILAIYLFRAYLTAALFAFIFFAGEMEYRAVKRRDAEDAYWREVRAQLSMIPPPLKEPPLLEDLG